MKNGNEVTSQKYDELSEYLLSHIDQEGIDRVTVRSLAGACMEFEETGIPKNSMVFANPVKSGEAVSIKFSNVRFNLKLAFDIILLSPSKPFLSKSEVILFIVKILKLTFTEMIETLDNDMLIILKAVYILSYDNHGADLKKIINYAEENGLNQEKAMDIIRGLDSIKCITLDDGEYKLTETIVLNLRN